MFDYTDPLGKVDNSSMVMGMILNHSFSGAVSDMGYLTNTSTPFNGSIVATVNGPCESPVNAFVYINVFGRTSPQTTALLNGSCNDDFPTNKVSR